MRWVLAAGLLALGCAAAAAQTPPPAFSPFPTVAPQPGAAPFAPQGGMHGMPGFRAMGGREGERMPFPPSKGAQFHFRDGPMRFDIRCGENDAVKDCAEAARTLMETFSAHLPPPPPPPPPPADAKPAAPPPAPAK